jgi:hypothetical protein
LGRAVVGWLCCENEEWLSIASKIKAKHKGVKYLSRNCIFTGLGFSLKLRSTLQFAVSSLQFQVRSSGDGFQFRVSFFHDWFRNPIRFLQSPNSFLNSKLQT